MLLRARSNVALTSFMWASTPRCTSSPRGTESSALSIAAFRPSGVSKLEGSGPSACGAGATSDPGTTSQASFIASSRRRCQSASDSLSASTNPGTQGRGAPSMRPSSFRFHVIQYVGLPSRPQLANFRRTDDGSALGQRWKRRCRYPSSCTHKNRRPMARSAQADRT